VDNIEITYPIASVEISNISFAPLYPADSENVEISCDIFSTGIFATAVDITARVYYKLSTETNYTAQPVEMSASGNHYVTSPDIPSQAGGSTVDYYIESTFKGYSRIETNSPTFSPTDGSNSVSPHSYDVRSHESSYGSIVMNTINGNVEMKQVSDENWIGIINFTTPTNDTPIIIQGKDYYDGTNLVGGTAIEWGDDAQSRIPLPYVGQMVAGNTNLTIQGEASGQYILDFNEVTAEYVLRHGAYQDFNGWPASPNYFETSYGAPDVIEFVENFSNISDWPLTIFDEKQEDFTSNVWVAVDHYPITSSDSFETDITPSNIVSYIGRSAALIITQAVGQAIMLDDGGSVRTHHGIQNEGTRNFAFDLRCVNDDLAPATYTPDPNYQNLMIEAKIKADAIPKNSNGNSLGYTYVSILGHYESAATYYELRLIQSTASRKGLEIWKYKNGTYTQKGNTWTVNGQITEFNTITLLIYENSSSSISLQAFLDGSRKINTSDSSDCITGASDIAISGMDADISVDHVKVFRITSADYDTGDPIYTELFSTSPAPDWNISSYPWTVETTGNGYFLRPGYTDTPINFTVDYIFDSNFTGAPSDDDPDWETAKTFTGYANSSYSNISQQIERPEKMCVRIRQSSTGGDGHLVVDNLDADYWHGDDFPQTNGWAAYETSVMRDMENLPDGTNVLNMQISQAYPSEIQNIRSPLLNNGAGIIEFDYKTSTTATNQLIFSIDYTLDGHLDQWQTGTIITNTITNTSFAPTNWTAYAWSLPEGSGSNDYQMYMRIQNQSTNWGAGMLLDNIRITEPIPFDDNAWRGYNALVTGNETERLIAEPNNIKGAYLNNNPTNDTDNMDFSEEQPYIETSMMPYGIGEVSFWYRAWDTTVSRIDIIGSDDRMLDEDDWHLLQTIDNITNQNFQYFSNNFYEPDYKYLRLRVPSDIVDMGRACIENLMIAQPFGATVYLRNMTLIPALPLVGDEVRIKADLYDTFYNPSNISLQAIYTTDTNNWGQYIGAQSKDMDIITTNGNIITYENSIPFRAGGHAIDTIVQYHVQATFDGHFSEESSPTTLKSFTNPPHYWPVDLNTNQPNKTPYYIVFSCLPGQVWINELNIVDDYAYPNPSPTQYIELCGISDIDISRWKINSYNIDANANVTTNAKYSIPDDTQLPHDTTNHFGFYLLGTNLIDTHDLPLTNTLPMPGGVQLFRSMGALEHSICYDAFDGDWSNPTKSTLTNNPTYRFVYIGSDDDAEDTALYATGTGSNLTDFANSYIYSPFAYSPGAKNNAQTLIAWPGNTNAPAYDGTLEIDSFTTTATKINMVVTAETNGVTLTPWYTTNLITGPWNSGIGQSYSLISGTVYNVSCDLYTNAPGAFYKVTAP